MSSKAKRYLISLAFYFIGTFVGTLLMQIELILQTGSITQAALRSAIIGSITATVQIFIKPLKDKINKYLLANPLDLGQ